MLVFLRQTCRFLPPYRDYRALPQGLRQGDGQPEGKVATIEFDRVSFTYPRGHTPVLMELTLRVAAGDRLSIVGVNGAGKTTLVKLPSRLYEPDAGCIRLNGVDIRTLDYEAYVRQLAVVFQDFKLLSFSLRENVALDQADDGSDARTMTALEKAGLGPKVAALDRGLGTSIYKNLDERGIAFSGG